MMLARKKKNREGWAVIASRGRRGREVVLILSSLSFSLTGFLPGCSLSPSQISQPGNPGIGSAAVLMRRLMSFVGESFHSKSGYRGVFFCIIIYFFVPATPLLGPVMNFAGECQDG